MSLLSRALVGYIIGLFFRMPMLGLMLAIFWQPQTKAQKRSRRSSHKTHHESWSFNEFIRGGHQEGRWVQGCFSSLGAFAKAGKKVTQDDINFAESLMQRWNYTAEHREQAINAFRYGRQENASDILHPMAQSYYWTHSPQGQRLIQILNEYLALHKATPLQKQLLQQWAHHLGSPHQRYSYEHFYQQNQNNSSSHNRSQTSSHTDEDLSWAYKTLGADASEDLASVKKKFRKIIARVHPDRNSNDPKATEKTQKIQKAYALIKQAKGWT